MELELEIFATNAVEHFNMETSKDGFYSIFPFTFELQIDSRFIY